MATQETPFADAPKQGRMSKGLRIPDPDLRAALNLETWVSLRISTIGLGSLLAVLGPLAMRLFGSWRQSLLIVDLVVAFTLLLAGVLLRRMRPRPQAAPALGAAVVLLVAADTLFHMWATQDIVQTTMTLIVLSGAAVLILSPFWLSLAYAVIWLAWIGIVVAVPITGPYVLTFGVAMVVATLVGWMVYYQRVAVAIAAATASRARAAAENEMEERARRILVLSEASMEMNARQNLPALLNGITRRAVEMMGAGFGGAYLLQPDGTLKLAFATGPLEPYVGASYGLEEGLAGRAATTGKPQTVNDLRLWQDRSQVEVDLDYRRVLSVPLQVGGRVVGVVEVVDNVNPGLYRDEDARLITLFADQAANALENTQLVDQLRQENLKRARDEDRLRAYAEEIQKTNEALAVARDQALQASRLKSDFLSTMSHELRTPLNAIMGMNELMLDTELTSEQRDFVDTVGRNSETLLDLVNDIRDLARIEAGKMDLDEHPLDLEDLVESASDLVLPAAAEKGLDLTYEIAPETPFHLMGDITRLRQMLVNVLRSMITIRDEGSVTIGVKASGPEDGAQNVHFTVLGLGAAATAEQEKRLRELACEDATGSSQFLATMGPAFVIMERLAEMMGGLVWGERTTDGRGAIIHFLVPLELASEEAATLRTSVVLVDKQLLIVVDGAIERESIMRWTESWGARIISAASFGEAITRLTSDVVYDAIIVDLELTPSQGRLLSEAVNEQKPTPPALLVAVDSSGAGV